MLLASCGGDAEDEDNPSPTNATPPGPVTDEDAGEPRPPAATEPTEGEQSPGEQASSAELVAAFWLWEAPSSGVLDECPGIDGADFRSLINDTGPAQVTFAHEEAETTGWADDVDSAYILRCLASPAPDQLAEAVVHVWAFSSVEAAERALEEMRSYRDSRDSPGPQGRGMFTIGCGLEGGVDRCFASWFDGPLAVNVLIQIDDVTAEQATTVANAMVPEVLERLESLLDTD